MNITINSLPLGAGTDYKISSPIEGLETPPIRTSSMNFSGQDGGRVNAQFYAPRLITVTGFIISDTCEDHEQARRDLMEALIIGMDLDVTITTFAGNSFVTSVRVLDVDMPITSGKTSIYKIDLFASDPSLYTDELISVILDREIGGGFILPVILPIVFAPGSAPVTVTNTGNITVYPTITIVGSATNPRITREDTGEFFEVGITMGVSDELVINMKERTVTLNGSSVISFIDPLSDWLDVDPGANLFSYSTDSGGDTGVTTLTYRNAVIAI